MVWRFKRRVSWIDIIDLKVEDMADIMPEYESSDEEKPK
jgi:hypothetical protein